MIAQSGRSCVVFRRSSVRPPCWFLRQRRPEYTAVFQFTDVNVAQGIEDKREEAFHIGGAEPVEFVVVLGKRKRVAAGPTTIVERHGIGMPGEQQAASAVAGTGQHIEFITRLRYRLDLDVKAQIAEPAAEQID